MDIGRVLFPALRWDDDRGYGADSAAVREALDLGVGGFILFGGRADAARALADRLERDAGRPLLLGSDLERGAGQQLAGATRLPPLAAIGFLDDEEVARRAGELTGREAVAAGVPWVYAPMADVDLEPLNPIVGTRAFGTDPDRVASLVVAWIEGCRSTGALACAKHFPGHGRTTTDSHLELPRVDVGEAALDVDLVPFRAAISAGVDSMMTAHVAYPALDASGSPATLSAPIVTGLLRDRLGFRGVAVTDALIMEGVHGDEGVSGGEPAAAVRALAAGCDALLYPDDAPAVAAGIRSALDDGRLSDARVLEAISRVEAMTARAAAAQRPGRGGWGSADDARWALETATRAVHMVRGERPRLGEDVTVATVDDDLGGAYPPPSRDVFPERLRAAGRRVRASGGDPATASAPDDDHSGPLLIAVYADIRAWKGRPGLSPAAIDAVARLSGAGPATVCLFGHPRLAADLRDAPTIVCAWGGEAIMQEAAADWLAGGA
ncbi:MAG TPA: glycoside hydrolase family 3 N-terminal domain-containing protein [Longimicrobiales bacterium]|nr:glycoside hydrolase family 3 N-terminal domain-containing protein [Longimicrobiales bacterium]